MTSAARKKATVSPTLINAAEYVTKIGKMSVGQLQGLWLDLNGEPTRSRNKAFLQKRLAFRVQEMKEGGLTPRARSQIKELGKDAAPKEEERREERKKAAKFKSPDEDARRTTKPRDPRLPKAGTVLDKEHHGKKHKVIVHENDFEYQGHRYGSLSSVAGAITGATWNGFAFFGLHAKGAAK